MTRGVQGVTLKVLLLAAEGSATLGSDMSAGARFGGKAARCVAFPLRVSALATWKTQSDKLRVRAEPGALKAL